ncbi:Probable protease SohB [Candidatus Erwinia haradaeae]|uniref:Probable protease SohB n=1 Tax=Candidatus Erwinia haradaeae TaxID=1922217 RepID=A0A451DJI9_9GAMM|nr:protease SohB [Candidatus Erwinia haradaeae]VFP86860.1 Probable protease SohB [Candidatus Erwinia haradaeae]
MDLLSFYGLFLAKIITIIITLVIVSMILPNLTKRSNARAGKLILTRLDKYYLEIQNKINLEKLTPLEQKLWKKEYKKNEKKKQKESKQKNKIGHAASKKRPTLYILDFIGSMDAKEVSSLRQEISAIISVIETGDEVLLRLESPGGVVHGYGLAASQLQRLRQKDIPLTVSVDKIATSGGYMMACVANHIVAAPFALIGSIGVVAQIPNFHRLLKRKNIDMELHTAGEYKRTLTLFGENSEEGREKFRDTLNQTHALFKQFVHQMRPQINIDMVSTGEHWYGSQALNKGLIDSVSTSDDFIIDKMSQYSIINLCYTQHRGILERFSYNIYSNITQIIEKTLRG